MAGMGFILGGALKGGGDSVIEQAKAKREAALEELRWQRQMTAAGDQRAFSAEESEKDRAFRKEEGNLTRAEQEKRDKREDERRREQAKADRYAETRQEMINSGMTPEEASREALKTVNEYDRNSKLPTYSDPSEVEAAVAAGKIKPGASFVMPDGSIGKVPAPAETVPTPAVDSTATGSTATEKTKAGELAGSAAPASKPARNPVEALSDGFRDGVGLERKERAPKARGGGYGW